MVEENDGNRDALPESPVAALEDPATIKRRQNLAGLRPERIRRGGPLPGRHTHLAWADVYSNTGVGSTCFPPSQTRIRPSARTNTFYVSNVKLYSPSASAAPP